MSEVRMTSSTGGQKAMKAERMDLLPPEAMLALSRIYAKGAEKYSDHNFRRGYPWSQSKAALDRHVALFWSGQDLDDETGEPHILHAAWHCIALWLFMQEHPDFDDRYSTVKAWAVEAESDDGPTASEIAAARMTATAREASWRRSVGLAAIRRADESGRPRDSPAPESTYDRLTAQRSVWGKYLADQAEAAVKADPARHSEHRTANPHAKDGHHA